MGGRLTVVRLVWCGCGVVVWVQAVQLTRRLGTPVDARYGRPLSAPTGYYPNSLRPRRPANAYC